MKPVLRTFATLFAVTMLSASAYAQDDQGGGGGGGGGGRGQGPRAACKQDVQTFCNGVKPGGGRIIECLEDHSKEISDGCYSMLQKAEDRMQSRKQGGGGGKGPVPGGDDSGNGGGDNGGGASDNGGDSKPAN